MRVRECECVTVRVGVERTGKRRGWDKRGIGCGCGCGGKGERRESVRGENEV